MQLEYILTAVVVLVGLVYLFQSLWRSRATPESAPDPFPLPNNRSTTSATATSKSAAPASTTQAETHSQDSAPIVDRLTKEPRSQIDPDSVDSQALIARGTSSLRAILEKVRTDADSWVSLYTPMALVAEGLGEAGRDTVAQLLAEAEADHHGRLVSFLGYAAGKMKPALCESLCAQVDSACAEPFGNAAAHFGKKAIEIIVKRLRAASGAQAAALRELLTATFASMSFRDDKTWLAALKNPAAIVRAAAVAANRGSEHQKAIHKLIDDADEAVRYAALCHADELPNSTLIRLIENDSPRIRAIATWKLGGDEAQLAAIYQKLLHDAHPGVALMAAISLEHPSCEERIFAALDSADAATRDCAVRVSGFLSPEKYGEALARLEKSGHVNELADAVGAASDDAPSLKHVAALALRSPPTKVLRSAEIQLAFSDEDGVIDLSASLLAPDAPPRVRRAGFYAVTPHRDAWVRYLEPLLHPDEPLLEDLIDELESALAGDEDFDRSLFERLKQRHPNTVLHALATHALSQK